MPILYNFRQRLNYTATVLQPYKDKTAVFIFMAEKEWNGTLLSREDLWGRELIEDCTAQWKLYDTNSLWWDISRETAKKRLTECFQKNETAAIDILRLLQDFEMADYFYNFSAKVPNPHFARPGQRDFSMTAGDLIESVKAMHDLSEKLTLKNISTEFVQKVFLDYYVFADERMFDTLTATVEKLSNGEINEIGLNRSNTELIVIDDTLECYRYQLPNETLLRQFAVSSIYM